MCNYHEHTIKHSYANGLQFDLAWRCIASLNATFFAYSRFGLVDEMVRLQLSESKLQCTNNVDLNLAKENIKPVKIIVIAESSPHSVYQYDSEYTVISKFLPPCSFGIVRPSQQDATMTGRCYCMQVSYVLQHSVRLCTNIHHNCMFGYLYQQKNI